MQQSTVEDLVREIEHFRSRIGMYIQPVDVVNTMSFLTGFTTAACLFGIQRKRDLWWRVQELRGWKQAAVGPVPQTRAKGLSERQIIDELIDIEIAVLRQSATVA